MRNVLRVAGAACLFCTITCFLLAAADDDTKADKPTTPPANAKFPAPKAEEKTSKTQHTVRLNGQDLHYTAVAGTLVLKKDEGNGEPIATIFYVAYTLDGADSGKRPVTFTFNGGPGSSSVWLHMGALGPKRVVLTDEGQAVPPPYRVADNDQTALAFTDLVFIDPVTTGFSRHAPGEDPKQFHGVEEDLESVGSFIQLYLTKYDRWNSPKFLAGESYGTTRAAGLSKLLLEKHGIYLNGITLISSALDFATLSFEGSNDLPYIVFLPSFATTAWYHKKLSPEMQARDLAAVAEAARQFAETTYAQALMKGDKLSAEERQQVVRQLAGFIGLSPDFIDRCNLRVSDERFFKELLRGERELIGRYDSRIVSYAVDPASEHAEYDPSYAAVQGAFTAAFNDYVRRELNWQTDLPYNILTPKVWPWNMSEFVNGYVNTAVRLDDAVTQNPFMHVLQMNGYYDLATPFFSTEYTFNHLNLAPPLRQNITMGYCGAGHMLYLKSSCRDELHKDMAGMYQSALPAH
jgi:carboxypeptidase C (cathepsin A)